MKLTLTGIQDKAAYEKAGILLPPYDAKELQEKTKENPAWVHFGIGNIFRIFIGSIADQLIRDKKIDTGITCVESFDFDVVDQIFQPFDNLMLSVILNNDGTTKKQVLAPFGESLKAKPDEKEDWQRLKTVFRSPSLQIVSFTITEKGYQLTGADGNYYGFIEKDIENGPYKATSAMAIVTSMLKERYDAGALPIALISMDNCSHNGEKLESSVNTIAEEWLKKGYVDDGFINYLHDTSKVAFPWTMIDKITPRPSDAVAAMLKDLGMENMDAIVTDKKTFIAPFGNAEEAQYLVIEDTFPNGRPPLEDADVYLADRETVNKSERMKVNTCLNPIHTALCTYDCMLGYDLFADGMSDPDLSRLAHRIGYIEGLPVVADPGIINPKEFLDEVINVRMPNPYLGDTSQRIAVDISQMVGIRFGETIKSYVAKDGTAEKLTGIALAIAGWLRYLLEVDDEGNHFDLAPDPMIPELQKMMSDIDYETPDSVQNHLYPILSNANIFGSDLYEAGLGNRIEQMFKEEISGPGAVRKTLKKYLDLEEK